MQTYIKKDYRGNWRASTEVVVDDNRVATITTSKSSYGLLTTHVSVGKRDGDFISHMMFQDYSKTVKSSQPKRVTEKLVSAQHDEVLADIDWVLDDIKAFYSLETA